MIDISMKRIFFVSILLALALGACSPVVTPTVLPSAVPSAPNSSPTSAPTTPAAAAAGTAARRQYPLRKRRRLLRLYPAPHKLHPHLPLSQEWVPPRPLPTAWLSRVSVLRRIPAAKWQAGAVRCGFQRITVLDFNAKSTWKIDRPAWKSKDWNGWTAVISW